jgi:hypothetical protein
MSTNGVGKMGIEKPNPERKALRVAAIQMDANPAPISNRLERAERLIAAVVRSGANLAVLPELFNTGYSYSRETHALVEKIDGPTVNWMRSLSSRLDVHIAGSLMLLDQGDVYNALLLFSPDGTMWRYDKNYPAGWERGFYRESRQNPKITVAETALGNIGLMVCWDSAHLELWRQYAGQVDMMVVCSCPPNISDAIYHFPNGDQLTIEDLGSIIASTKGSIQQVFGEMLNQQTAWLGVPAVNSTGCGSIHTHIPNGRQLIFGNTFLAPWLLKYLSIADRMHMSCDIVQECKIIDRTGKVLSKVPEEEGESFTITDVNIPDSRPMPKGHQPPSLLPRSAYFFEDIYINWISRSVYQKASFGGSESSS